MYYQCVSMMSSTYYSPLCVYSRSLNTWEREEIMEMVSIISIIMFTTRCYLRFTTWI